MTKTWFIDSNKYGTLKPRKNNNVKHKKILTDFIGHKPLAAYADDMLLKERRELELLIRFQCED